MPPTASDLLESTTRALAPDPGANPLVPLIARGEAGLETLALLALEQSRVIPADRRAFGYLAERAADEPEAAAFFRTLADGETLAEERLGAFAEACGVDAARAAAHRPSAGCQAYPAHVAWLALNAAPADAVLALTANFSAWGGYCATIAGALRRHYGFPDAACAFFDFFATPAPALERQALDAVRAGLDTGRLDPDRAHHHGRLLQAYEAMFWTTLRQPA
ncbi:MULTISPECIES: transcriptional regulator [unclassified Streptomyces]|uniref:transcriptional regulator n=1 Tax=unclassified Streptomyces TaxID=2593676 RepID=UPI0037006CA1